MTMMIRRRITSRNCSFQDSRQSKSIDAKRIIRRARLNYLQQYIGVRVTLCVVVALRGNWISRDVVVTGSSQCQSGSMLSKPIHA